MAGYSARSLVGYRQWHHRRFVGSSAVCLTFRRWLGVWTDVPFVLGFFLDIHRQQADGRCVNTGSARTGGSRPGAWIESESIVDEGNATVTERTVWNLAARADVAEPDTEGSAGADFLRRVESAVDDVLQYGEGADIDDYRDGITEQADSCVPVYTHQRWAAFVDLGAYGEDIDELGQPGDLTTAAGYALYLIAERLLTALVEDVLDERAEAADDEGDDDTESSASRQHFIDTGRYLTRDEAAEASS